MLISPKLIAGSFTRTGYECLTALFPKSGATRGSITVTFAGTPSYGVLVNYEFSLKNVLSGQSSKQSGLFMYSRRPGAASLAGFIDAFSKHLAIYHDVSVSAVTATSFVLTSSYYGFNPALVVNSGVTSTSATGSLSVGASKLIAGDAVALKRLSGNWVISPVIDPLTTTDNIYGLVVNDRTDFPVDGRDAVVNIAVDGYMGVECRGTATGTTASSSMVMYTNGTRPGSFGFGGLTDGATTSLQVNSSNNTATAALNFSRQFRPTGEAILPGSVFEMKINSLI